MVVLKWISVINLYNSINKVQMTLKSNANIYWTSVISEYLFILCIHSHHIFSKITANATCLYIFIQTWTLSIVFVIYYWILIWTRIHYILLELYLVLLKLRFITVKKWVPFHCFSSHFNTLHWQLSSNCVQVSETQAVVTLLSHRSILEMLIVFSSLSVWCVYITY